MLDLDRLRRIKLHEKPIGHKLVGSFLLGPSYWLPRRTKIIVEGAENLPEEPAVLAMNHTDRYNYWPFQYWLWRKEKRFTATWVKGKYYENAAMGRFMEMTNNIPAPSRGYVMTRDFLNLTGKRPTKEEYAALKELGQGKDQQEGLLPVDIANKPRDMLGRDFVPSLESYQSCLDALKKEMTAEFVSLNARALQKRLHLLIFPEGTRSIRLSKGRVGVSQAALRFQRPIVPIGCNGSEKVYPGGNPWARGGLIVYRIGEPISLSEVNEHALDSESDPFEDKARDKDSKKLQGLADLTMHRINDLLDPEYQYDKA